MDELNQNISFGTSSVIYGREYPPLERYGTCAYPSGYVHRTPGRRLAGGGRYLRVAQGSGGQQYRRIQNGGRGSCIDITLDG